MKHALCGKPLGMLALALVLTMGGRSSAAIVAEWDFDSIASGVVPDRVGLTDLTASGDVTLVPSEAGIGGSGFGQAVEISAATSDLLTGSVDALGFGSGAFTVTGWLRPNADSDSSVYRFVVENGVHNQGGYNVWIGPSNRSWRGKLGFDLKGAAANVTVQSDARLDDGQWHWFAVVSDGAEISMFVDGLKQTAVASIAGTIATPPLDTIFSVGDAFDGGIDQLTIHDKALSSSLSGATLTDGELYNLWQQAIPEPATFSLLALGGAVLLVRRRATA